MGIYDTIMLILLAAATFIGWRKGIVSQIGALVSLGASFFVAATFFEQIAPKINAPDPWNRVGAFVIIYVGTSLVVWLFFRQVRQSVKRMQLSDFDRQLGGFLGLAKGVALAAVVTLVCVNLFAPGTRETIANSRTGSMVSSIVHTVGPMAPPRVQEFLASYVRQLDEVLGRTEPGLTGPYQYGQSYPSNNSTNPYPAAPTSSYPRDMLEDYPYNSQSHRTYIPPGSPSSTRRYE